MEDFNPDDPLEIDARRDENEEENDCKATKEKDDEKRVYDEVCSYLTASRYPEDATKADKATIRKRSKKFEVVDGVLHYKVLLSRESDDPISKDKARPALPVIFSHNGD